MRILLLVALLALIGCKGGSTKCRKLTIHHADRGVSTHFYMRYRVLREDPLTIEWATDKSPATRVQYSGVEVVTGVRCDE